MVDFWMLSALANGLVAVLANWVAWQNAQRAREVKDRYERLLVDFRELLSAQLRGKVRIRGTGGRN